VTPHSDGDRIRELLLNAVPDLRAPEDRLASVAARVRRRRWAQGCAAGAACVLVLLGAGALFRPGATPGPVGGPSLSQPASPTATPATTATASASTTPTTSGTPAVKGPGVSYDRSRIPAGYPGSGDLRVTRTGAMPGTGVGAFRQVCQYSHMLPEDPILLPGKANASPLMVFAGNTAAGASSTAATIAGSGDGTCWGGIADRSAYWTTAVIDTRTGTPVAPTEFSIRYSANYPRRDQVQTMPAGLRLLANQATWGCWDGTLTTYDRPPICPRNAPLVLNIWFPRCWDGTRLDSPDHRSHVTYPAGSTCPADHPVPIPQLEYHVLYVTPTDGGLSAWRLSNDTTVGGGPVLGYGGFLEGWSPQIRQTWTDDCVRIAAICESHLLGDGRVIDGKGDI
jgi:hypothetical protein